MYSLLPKYMYNHFLHFFYLHYFSFDDLCVLWKMTLFIFCINNLLNTHCKHFNGLVNGSAYVKIINMTFEKRHPVQYFVCVCVNSLDSSETTQSHMCPH